MEIFGFTFTVLQLIAYGVPAAYLVIAVLGTLVCLGALGRDLKECYRWSSESLESHAQRRLQIVCIARRDVRGLWVWPGSAVRYLLKVFFGNFVAGFVAFFRGP